MSSDNDAPPTISYTSKRTTTKTRTAATSARRRKNIPLCHASGSDNPDFKDQNSWFARKSVGWTDEEIKNHVVSGGVSNGGNSFSMVGDVILGASSSTSSKKDKKKKKKRRMKQFAWEEDDEEDIEVDGGVGIMMTAADIMDEQDEVDFMAPVSVNTSYQMQSSTNTDSNIQDNTAKSANKSKSRRRQNAALDELAQVCGDNASSNIGQSTSANESIGWRLLRVLGYRSRLRMAFVPLAGHVGGLDSIDNEVKDLGNGKHEAKWLASKRLRAIRLPSIQNVDDSNNSTDATKRDKKKIKVLTIPPPKVNRHGIGFDPFKNAPEFRKFHERRQELAKKQGRSTEEDTARGSNRYSTDNFKDGRQALWDKARSDVNKDSEDEMSDPGAVKSHHQSSSHYAADRDYTDFIGTKASSGFALHDEDDANVYQDGEGRGDNGDGGEYTTEIHSPVASEDEDDNNGLGLFGKPAIMKKKSKASERGMKGAEENGKVAADAWSAWGIGESPAAKRTTMDGKPPLSGFTLAASTDSQAKSDAPKRWKGPIVPSGYVLKHHVFTKEEDGDIKESTVGLDSGLGLNLQRRQEQEPSRAFVPNVPPSRMQPPPPPDGKMLSRGGNEMNFHAVKESMKNRFTSAAEITNTTNIPESEVKDDNNNKQDMDEEEWVTVEVSTWLPTRLLCKRWGITAPSTVGVSETGKGGMVQSKEESYFRQTIMAEHPDVGSSNTKTPATSGSKVKAADNGVQIDNFLGDDDQEDMAQSPERPSDAVFQSIFNAESDMDISSDDDNESDGDDLDTTRANDETDVKNESAASVDRSPLPQTNGSFNADIKPQPADHSNDNTLLPATDSTDSDSSGSSRHRRKRRKKSDERKSHRRSDSDSDEEDRRRRKKKKHKHKRSKHKKSRH